MSRPSRKITKLKPFGEFITMSKKASSRMIEVYKEQQAQNGERQDTKIKYINVTGKTTNQREYQKMMGTRRVIFGIGPAGTGKTLLPIAFAIKSIVEGNANKLVICRPAIEAGGERLGFLPGDCDMKIDPYLQPMFRAMAEVITDPGDLKRFKAEHVEIIQFAFMRGLTFKDSIVIADECQNLLESQLDLLVTRFGKNCKMIINGDLTQSDLLQRDQGALDRIAHIVSASPRFGIVRFGKEDIMRDPIVEEYLTLKEEATRPRELGETFQGYHDRDDIGGW